MARTGNLRRRPTTPPAAKSTEDARQLMMGPSGTQVDLRAPIQEATGEEVQPIGFIKDFSSWISHSEFLRLQQPEPMVGGTSADYPPSVEDHGIKGKSVYTALFDHLDMDTFTCKLCSHIVNDLEEAITHQRSDHFNHYPYRCPAPHTQW